MKPYNMEPLPQKHYSISFASMQMERPDRGGCDSTWKATFINKKRNGLISAKCQKNGKKYVIDTQKF